MLPWKEHVARKLAVEANLVLKAGEDYPPVTKKDFPAFLKEFQTIKGLSPSGLMIPFSDAVYNGDITHINLGTDFHRVWFMHLLTVHSICHHHDPEQFDPFDPELHQSLEALRQQIFHDRMILLISSMEVMAHIELELEMSGAFDKT